MSESAPSRPSGQVPLAVTRAFDRRRRAGAVLADSAAEVARTCQDMADRFHRGGQLLVFGNGLASTDAMHIAVEFVHPVIVGKRALPARALATDVATLSGVANHHGFAEVFAHQLRQLARPADIAFGISTDGGCANVAKGLQTARELGLLTVALVGGSEASLVAGSAVDHLFRVPAVDPLVVKEVQVSIYHVLWELVHVFFETPGVLAPEVVGAR